MNISENLRMLRHKIPGDVSLIAVSKTHSVENILEAYQTGQRDFGENKVQELLAKQSQLPGDIHWHHIGHLQSNKVKYIVPFVHLIHAVDSVKLLKEINKEAAKINRVINCLLQIHIAQEDTKFGFSPAELQDWIASEEFKTLPFIRICGLMGMATYTPDEKIVKGEFLELQFIFNHMKNLYLKGEKNFRILSMGMSSDYELAIECGSNMVRLGSLIFGERDYGND